MDTRFPIQPQFQTRTKFQIQTESELLLVFTEDEKTNHENFRYKLSLTNKDGKKISGMWLLVDSPILFHLKQLAQLKGGTLGNITKKISILKQALREDNGDASLNILNELDKTEATQIIFPENEIILLNQAQALHRQASIDGSNVLAKTEATQISLSGK